MAQRDIRSRILTVNYVVRKLFPYVNESFVQASCQVSISAKKMYQVLRNTSDNKHTVIHKKFGAMSARYTYLLIAKLKIPKHPHYFLQKLTIITEPRSFHRSLSYAKIKCLTIPHLRYLPISTFSPRYAAAANDDVVHPPPHSR